MRDIFIEILTTIKHNRLRTALTGFSVAWGIFILIVLLGAGNGLINATMGNSSRFLATSMVVYGGETSKAYDGLGENRDVQLNDKDFNITSKGFPNNVKSVGAELSQQGETLVNGSDYTTGINLSGVYPNDVEINKRTMICGRFINELDLKERRKSIVISSDMAKELLPQSPLSLNGQMIRTTTLAFRVVGIYESQKNSMGNDAFIPFTTFRAIYNKGDKTGNIVFSFSNLNSEAENEAFESDYRARINRQHRAAPDDENAIWIWNRFTQALSMDTATGLLRTALWVIGILTLISGIVGVSNIMLITVRERTHEFGIRKAIGAKPWSILRLIIIESIVITTFFGYIGMVLGIAANLYMDATIGQETIDNGLFAIQMFTNPTVGIDVCVKATLLMIVAGTLAGMVPARKAAKIRPIEALRAE
ncbi:efflux ABC transporter, permease protein [Leyella stercorea DSM 18206]|uniref:Efflux ABC transporter, permease protein n=2 Tax=Leyella stercorea TaxID=363265 RepID=G6B0Q0_9BACT|nr:ABC transporter permease [Leyella stercorea]EHJ37213.1 efflux ABC transporter, permease protein [Leyella stercorea DSM 18206]